MKTAYIFAGGELGNVAIDSEAVSRGANIVICADSGYKHALTLGIEPDVIVGDFDSYGGDLPESAEIHRSVPEKDDTDTLMAVKIAIERGYKHIELFAALGGRRFDHSVANIQTMLYAREHGAEMVIVGDDVLFLQDADDGPRMYKRNSGYFSVFAITEAVRIRYLRGVKYPLGDYKMLRSFPIGVSNEITDDFALLSIDSGTALVIQQADTN